MRAPLIPIATCEPMGLVCMDYLSLKTSKGGYANILIIIDHFTKYAQAVPKKDQTAKTTANALFNHYLIHYGLPRRLHSDIGASFVGNIISELCTMTGLSRSTTTLFQFYTAL